MSVKTIYKKSDGGPELVNIAGNHFLKNIQTEIIVPGLAVLQLAGNEKKIIEPRPS
jgi:hypothetical protein